MGVPIHGLPAVNRNDAQVYKSLRDGAERFACNTLLAAAAKPGRE